MEREILIESTLDGSHTLYVPQLDEHYHSINGAIQESKHIFIDAGLLHKNKADINILEVGFGTGLNAYMTLLSTEKEKRTVNYIGLELYPLGYSIIEKLNYAEKDLPAHQDLFEAIHTCDWNKPIELTPFFKLTKVETDFTKIDLHFDHKFDVIYFDAFAPDKQPEMWNQEVFDFLYSYTNRDGILTTYCAKGIVRRMLQQSGYKVERLPGPPGKREMLRAIR